MMKRMLLPAMLATLSGCAGMSGLGGSSNYSCSAPKGTSCTPMSTVYEQTLLGVPASAPGAAAQEEGKERHARETAAEDPETAPRYYAARPGTETGTRTALLSGPRVMRIYIAPWTDADDNLLDGRLAYVKIDGGQWNIGHIKADLRRSFAPIAPPITAEGADAAAPAKPSASVPAPLQALGGFGEGEKTP